LFESKWKKTVGPNATYIWIRGIFLLRDQWNSLVIHHFLMKYIVQKNEGIKYICCVKCTFHSHISIWTLSFTFGFEAVKFKVR